MARDPDKLGVSLSTRVAAILTRTRVDSTAALMPHVQQAVSQSVKTTLAGLKGADRATVREVLDDNFGFSPIDEKTASIVDGLYGIHPILATPLMAVALAMSIFRLLGAAAEPFVVATSNSAFQANPARVLDAGTAAQAVVRGFTDDDEGAEEAAAGGFSRQRWEMIRRLAVQRPQLTELFELRNRGVITDTQLAEGVRILGFDAETADRIVELRFAIPGPQDVVRFAVRDVYRPAAVQRGRLLDDLPEAGVADAERAGLTREEFEKFWAAHWVLPSITQAFEMLHRGEITENELRGLLRTQDIAPGWRDELLAISYNVISRVDIRRMYREGIADREKVYQTYLDQGYQPEDAEALTQFAIADATVDTRDLTKAEVVGLYESGAVTRSDASGMLTDLGYPTEEVEWLLVLSEFKRFRRFRDLAVSRVRSRYVGRRISESEASATLDQLGIQTEERDTLIDIWDAERDADRPRLTTAFIGGLYRDGHITEEEARVRWAQQGYRSADVDLLVLNYADGNPEAKESGGPKRQLTKADIGRALREGTLSTQDAVDAWVEMGYEENEALILARNYLPEEDT